MPTGVAGSVRRSRPFHHITPTHVGHQPELRTLPEFTLKDKVIVVSGGARGLGLVQAQALLEAGANGTRPRLDGLAC
jgi:hypothetical protein